MAQVLQIDEGDAQEEMFARNWTDGLPVVPPTPTRVDAMLAGAGLAATDVLGEIKERGRSLTAEKAAINAVMAGCLPEYFPVVVAALRAMLTPAFNAHTALTSTGGAASCLVVSGPYAEAIGMRSRLNVLGPGNRANMTIGRAVRLVAANVFGARTGEMDGSSIGHPGKLSMCLAEYDPPAPWEPLRVELGFDRAETTVTILATEGPRQVANHLNPDPAGVVLTFAAAMRNPATYCVGKGAQGLVILGYEHSLILHEAGWSKQQIREFLMKHSRISADELEQWGILKEKGSQHDLGETHDGKLPAIASIDDLFVVTAGGAGAGWSAYIPTWAPTKHNRGVTVAVELPGSAVPAVSDAKVAAVVAALAPGLQSDGADLRVQVTASRTIEFTLVIPSQACADCVMPVRMLHPIFSARVEEILGSGWTVKIHDPRDDANHPLNSGRS
jgi:hypothetical protein